MHLHVHDELLGLREAFPALCASAVKQGKHGGVEAGYLRPESHSRCVDQRTQSAADRDWSWCDRCVCLRACV